MLNKASIKNNDLKNLPSPCHRKKKVYFSNMTNKNGKLIHKNNKIITLKTSKNFGKFIKNNNYHNVYCIKSKKF